jgi:transcriptional regulator with XRE-family HTH domain
MARIRVKPIHPFIQELMVKHECETLAALSEKTGITPATLHRYANGLATMGPEVKALLESADKAGIPRKEFILALLELTA